jgi:hypothetical protein
MFTRKATSETETLAIQHLKYRLSSDNFQSVANKNALGSNYRGYFFDLLKWIVSLQNCSIAIILHLSNARLRLQTRRRKMMKG